MAVALLLLVVVSAVAVAPAACESIASPGLAADDECFPSSPSSSSSGQACGLHALQRIGRRVAGRSDSDVSPAEEESQGHEEASSRAESVKTSRASGKEVSEAAEEGDEESSVSADSVSISRTFGKEVREAALRKKTSTSTSDDVITAASVPRKCGSIDDVENDICSATVWWVAQYGKWDPHASAWFNEMYNITGQNYTEARLEDFQRLFWCSPPGGKACGLPPCSCSKEPCNNCFGGAPPKPKRKGCENDNSTSINCKPPASPMGYKGQSWPTMSFPGEKEMHIFAIGDWGGMDGTLNPIEGRPPVVAYNWGRRPGPSVFPRSRYDKYHEVKLCSHSEFIECYNTSGESCAESCGYVKELENEPQTTVARALKNRAYVKDPQYILNVGDNFYWGGIEKTCGTPMDEISFTAQHQFDQIFEGVYHGEGLDKKPWLSVLGNHDWGGRVFNNGWDQQIAYTWVSDRWVMPAPYWKQHVEYPDQNFSVDIYMIDSNFIDAKDPPEDSEHNLCGAKHNPENASCAVADGPESVESCPQFFQDLWEEQQTWLEEEMGNSTATWRIVVTHFPCGHEMSWYRKLHLSYGLDLLVTGHRHDQELWLPSEHWRNNMGGLTCIVTGGGGGITSEATPNPENTTDWYGEAQYGFYDLTISNESIQIQSINWNGTNLLNHTIHPK